MDFGLLSTPGEDLISDPHETVEQISDSLISWFFAEFDYSVGKRLEALLRPSDIQTTKVEKNVQHQLYLTNYWSAVRRIIFGSSDISQTVAYHTYYLPHIVDHRHGTKPIDLSKFYSLKKQDPFLELVSDIPAVEVPTYGGWLSLYRSAERNVVIFSSDDYSIQHCMVYPGLKGQAKLRRLNLLK